jgi:phospholipid/cholesterol/gamma-HCH transport system permease protein
MMPSAPSCTLSQDEASVLIVTGSWRLAQASACILALQDMKALTIPNMAVLDATHLTELDTAGALMVLQAVVHAGGQVSALTFRTTDPRHARIFKLVQARWADVGPLPRQRPWSWLAQWGQHGAAGGAAILGHLSALAQALIETGRALTHPGELRVRECIAQLAHAGVAAIPVVALVSGLIGVVFAYLLGLQAEQYGANIFVVDGVALGMTREFAPLLVATIVAGRSGAAFTAQLGTMKLTEEIDAIRMLGLTPEQVLVVPRVLALIICLPLLVFVGDLAGLTGAMMVAHTMLDITPTTFIERLQANLGPQHYLLGLAKAPVFALFIAVMGCRMGLTVARDTRAIGLSTTATVVQCIVAVIVLDALFAILFQAVGW